MDTRGSGQSGRDDVEKVLNRATSDPDYRARLLSDPEQALIDLGIVSPEGGTETPLRCSYTCMVAATCSKTCKGETCKCTDC